MLQPPLEEIARVRVKSTFRNRKCPHLLIFFQQCARFCGSFVPCENSGGTPLSRRPASPPRAAFLRHRLPPLAAAKGYPRICIAAATHQTEHQREPRRDHKHHTVQLAPGFGRAGSQLRSFPKRYARTAISLLASSPPYHPTKALICIGR